MTKNIKFKVDKREITGKKVRSLRQSGVIPGVVYGKAHQPINIQVEEKALEKVLDQVGFSTPLTLSVDEQEYFSIVKDFDRDPVKRSLINIEFQSISATDPIDAVVELEIVGRGESPAERAGLTVMQVMENVELRALPNEMPNRLEIKIDSLADVGDHVALKHITLPKGVTFTDKETDLNMAIVNVYDPAQLEAQNEAVGGDAEDISEVEADNGSAEEENTDADESNQNEAKTEK